MQFILTTHFTAIRIDDRFFFFFIIFLSQVITFLMCYVYSFFMFKKKKSIPISFRWHYIRQQPCSSDKGRGSDCRLEKHINNRTINEKRSQWWERNGRWRHKFIPESAAVLCNDSHFVFIWTISDGCDFT